jgi:hypothetical protein
VSFSFNSTSAVRSQGPRLSDLLEVEVHKDPTHHWAEARSPVANRASAALLVATHIARERQQRRRADAQDVLTWAADATPAISPSAERNGGSCESGDLPSKHPQPIRRTVGGRSARQRPRTRRRLRPAGQTGTSWHLRGYRRWLIDRDVTHGDMLPRTYQQNRKSSVCRTFNHHQRGRQLHP